MEEKLTRRVSMSSMFPSLAQSTLDAQYDAFVAQFAASSSLADLHRLVHQIDQETKQIDADLGLFVGVASKKHNGDISATELSRAKLLSAIKHSNQLTQVFSSANDLGHSLTLKIKALDQEIGNVNRAHEYVAKVQTLRGHIKRIQYAIDKQDWETAAKCVHYIKHQLLPALLNGRFASAVVPSAEISEYPGPKIELWIEELKTIFQDLFNEAANSRSVADITKYFQLFPLIDQPELGLNCYSKFICSIIAESAKALAQYASYSDEKLFVYAEIISKLFESVSLMLAQHSPLISKYYSDSYPNAIVYVVSKILREIDTQVGTIADTFYDSSRVERMLHDIKLHTFVSLKKFVSGDTDLSGIVNKDVISIVEVGDLVHGISTIMSYWSLYCKFIATNYFAANNEPFEGTAELALPNLLANGKFNKKIKGKWVPAFESLYLFYFRRSVEKAFTIEELPSLAPYLVASKKPTSPDQAPVSSVIEDITLVFHSTLKNVLESAHVSSVKTFINESYKILQEDFLNGFISRALEENLPRYNQILSLSSPQDHSTTGSPASSRTGTPGPETVGSFLKGASNALGNVVGSGTAMVSSANPSKPANNPKLTNFVLYLNTMATGFEFISQICTNFTTRDPSYLSNHFPFGIDNEKVSNIIKAEMLEPFYACVKETIRTWLLRFYEQSLKSKVLAMLSDTFTESNEGLYIVYSSSALNDPSTILKFKAAWSSIAHPYKQTLHTMVFDMLLRKIVENVAKVTEKKLLGSLKKFKINELGALKLDKDLSYMINEMCEEDYELKEKFVRVTQIALLVGMDSEEYELNSYSGEDGDGINWVLTPLERKQIRRFRV
ncbi:COG4-domain-containing protein [Metschnikowia bicuspidata]|uniref:Conserved oligomeric Golgi complex subunit 4 n=1 Tax=Metschnikowia bicuspidata TaxID=27322 RepID=A0A4V1J3K0_9ASCO|nr:COG4-domain-containing protein [Metschnikowia bicuspidata]